MRPINIKTITFCCVLLGMVHTSCRKLLEIPDPINTISPGQVFSTDKQANSAMAGVYTRMIHGDQAIFATDAATKLFSAGLITITGGLSADELYTTNSGASDYYFLLTNKITKTNTTSPETIWNSAYQTIYGANAIVEGIAASTAATLSDSVRRALTGEAKFVRAFAYFYLVNFFGDVPLVLTIDFNQTINMPRTPQQRVYEQIVADLKEAQSTLPENYVNGNNSRIRPNKFAATALLARVYLYLGDYANATIAATGVIDNTTLYSMEPLPNHVFSPSSREAIWQLQPTNTNNELRNAIPEGFVFLPAAFHTGTPNFALTSSLLHTFEAGDLRFRDWIDSTVNTDIPGQTNVFYFPFKYQTGRSNSELGGTQTAYYMMLRLAEMYLVRAEAAANGGPGGTAGAIADLNILRKRAGLQELPETLTQNEVKTAVAKERQTELFAEWGHRWLDLKRTGKAGTVLSAIANKQPWAGDYQLLYPIPINEITRNHFLTQNPMY